jgi:polar amino acid transport system substrate-binding protein
MPHAPLRIILALFAALAAVSLPAPADEVDIPRFWDSRENVPRPDVSTVERLRFLTTTDFYPFNYLDDEGVLRGFNIDLARALCLQLDLEAVCQVQALPWAELVPALQEGQGEAIIAGLAETAELRQDLVFTRHYLTLPARFVAPRTSRLAEPMVEAIAGKRVGVMRGTAHETMLRDLFPEAEVAPYSRRDWMMRDLASGRIAAIFGDGMRWSLLLDDENLDGCCGFVGGPYFSSEHLGRGLSIAIDRDNAHLRALLNHALREVEASGRLAELYLQHFPVSFY